MVKISKSRKLIFFVSQIVVFLLAVTVIVLIQVGAFAKSEKTAVPNHSEPTDAIPTLIVKSETPQPALEVVTEDSPQLPANSGNSGFGGGSVAEQACVEERRAGQNAIDSVMNEANELWNQVSALQAAAAASTDPTESQNLYSQATALGDRAMGLNELRQQMHDQFWAGHTSWGCGPNGLVFGN